MPEATSRLALACVIALTATTVRAANGPLVQANDPYYTSAESQLHANIARAPNTHRAKNIILFVGDGMGITTITASRIYQGQKAGRDGVSNKLTLYDTPSRPAFCPW